MHAGVGIVRTIFFKAKDTGGLNFTNERTNEQKKQINKQTNGIKTIESKNTNNQCLTKLNVVRVNT